MRSLRPARELDLGDELGLHEARSARRLHSRLPNGLARRRARVELPAQPLELRLVKAGADASGVAQRRAASPSPS